MHIPLYKYMQSDKYVYSRFCSFTCMICYSCVIIATIIVNDTHVSGVYIANNNLSFFFSDHKAQGSRKVSLFHHPIYCEDPLPTD